MGLFTKEVEDSLYSEGTKTAPRYGRIGGAGAASLFGAAALWSGIYINEAREVSLEVTFGRVTETVTTPGLKLKVPFFASRYGYSLARQTTRFGEETTLRTSDDVRLNNPFTIEYKIDENADLQNLYYQLKGTGEDIEDVVGKLARDVAVRVFEGLQVTDLAEEGVTNLITSRMQELLQAELAEKGWPITIIDVLSDGFELSPESEQVLERIIDIRQENARLDLRLENARKAEEVLRTEAAAYVAYAEELQAAGMPDDDIRCAIHDKFVLDSGNTGIAFADVCGSSNSQSGYAVTVPGSFLPQTNVPAAPQPSGQ